MAAQKHAKNCRNFFAVLNAYKPKTQLIKAHNFIESSRSYGSPNPKNKGFRELFLSENDFKTSSTVNFPKNIQILEGWKLTKYIEFRFDFFFITCSSTYGLNII